MRYYQAEDNFNKYFIGTLIVHLALFVLFYLMQNVLNLNLLDFSKPPQDMEIIQAAVRVDIVGMPKDTLKELENTKLDQTTTEEEVPTKTVEVEKPDQNEFKEKAKKVDLNKLLSDFSSKKVKTKKTEKKNINQTALRKLVLEGNKVSKGNNVKGDILDAKNQKFIEYVQSLPDQVRPFWKLPSYLASKSLQCRIRVYISNTGKVIRAEVIEPSGESEYDQKALNAVKKASPLSAPESEILSRVSSGQVVLGFPL